MTLHAPKISKHEWIMNQEGSDVMKCKMAKNQGVAYCIVCLIFQDLLNYFQNKLKNFKFYPILKDYGDQIDKNF